MVGLLSALAEAAVGVGAGAAEVDGAAAATAATDELADETPKNMNVNMEHLDIKLYGNVRSSCF